ncbi:hypothetical protein Acr_23g0010960 [Actinidia rufa]|uniref:Uncharacterized protein n=1 Tax=Actinidia rufa TaxID=165716 RepID=A0A7J0GPJ7_9ERIC|nr:hypothetical protein Acr_23g0010960 [Actinidia rufa]
MSKKIVLKKLSQIAKGEEPKSATQAAKGVVIGEKCQRDKKPDISPTKKGNKCRMATKVTLTIEVPREGTSANPEVVLGLNVSMMENPTLVMVLGSSLSGHGREMKEEAMTQQARAISHANEEMRRMKKDRDTTVERLEKEVAELKEKEGISKKSAIKEYKSSNDFQEVMEQIASKYFGEGFDLCKKQIGRASILTCHRTSNLSRYLMYIHD